jgi:hypothetical protein
MIVRWIFVGSIIGSVFGFLSSSGAAQIVSAVATHIYLAAFALTFAQHTPRSKP